MNKMYPKIQQTILVSIATVIGAQISFNLFRTDFTISIGMMAFPIALVLFGKYRVLPATFLSAAGVFASRILMHWMQSGEVDFYKYVPELVFYLVYGFLFYIYCRKNDYEISVHSTVPLFLADFCSNLIELLTRETTYGFDWRMLLSIFLIAVSRTVIIVAVLVFLNYYKFSLLRREHADRYQRLLILISKLNDEVVFMQKNRKMIEATMSTSYKLFQEMQKEHIDPELSKKAPFSKIGIWPMDLFTQEQKSSTISPLPAAIWSATCNTKKGRRNASPTVKIMWLSNKPSHKLHLQTHRKQ